MPGTPPTPPPVDYPVVITERYRAFGYGEYQWVKDDTPPPFALPTRTLDRSRVALIGSGGVYALGQVAFHYRDDISYRAIPFEIDRSKLRVTHFAYDLTDARRDPNCVLPLDPLAALVPGVIGSVASEALSFLGGIYSARRVCEVLAPRIVRHVQALDADLALLVPV